VLNEGAVDLSKPWPEQDKQLVATEAALVVRRDLDPELQKFLAQAAL
jgi:hypothetical protein